MNPRLAQKPQIGNNPNPLTGEWIKIYGIFILWNIMQLLAKKKKKPDESYIMLSKDRKSE